MELLKEAARQKLAAGQGELDLGLQTGAPAGLLPIISSQMGCLVDALATTSSLPPTRYPMTSTTPSAKSAAPHGVRTSLASGREY